MITNNCKPKNRVIAGVCVRLGGYFNTDPVVFRIFFLMLALFWGIGAGVYLLLAVFLPVDAKEKNENNQ